MALNLHPSAARFFSVFREYTTICAKSSSTCNPLIWSRLPATKLKVRQSTRQFYASPNRGSQRESLKPQNHYELFPNALPLGPPPRGPFTIDTRKLRNEFLQLQAKTHPDLHSGEDKARAEGLSMLVNEAYRTLQDPLHRTQYLLSLRGIDVAEDETLKIDDPELLMEVLEMRETIEAIEEEKDLEPLKDINNEKLSASIRVLEQAFKEDDMATAKAEAVRLRYWVNISDSLNSWEKGKPVVLTH